MSDHPDYVPIPRDCLRYLATFDAYLASPIHGRDGDPADAKACALRDVLRNRGLMPDGHPYYCRVA